MDQADVERLFKQATARAVASNHAYDRGMSDALAHILGYRPAAYSRKPTEWTQPVPRTVADLDTTADELRK
ncbi:MAG TPA: hypothetical protein VNZ52_12620 [Candidatus Thermoplasmatota archaeon]|nr:hypothetical protein [Candidatus Thermoplasmatota archaeon]